MRAVLTAFAAAAAFALPAAAMTLSSSELTDGRPIPPTFFYPRCGGQNLSPQVSWSAPPKGTKSLVLTMIDTDPKPSGWSHWIVVDLSAKAGMLPHGAAALPAGASGGVNGFGQPVYAGPCPPAGSGVHHYHLTIWSMPTAHTDVPPKAPADSVMSQLAAASIAHVEMIATAER